MHFGKVEVLGALIFFHMCINVCFAKSFSEPEEHPAIIQFFRYTDEISNYTAENIVDILLDFFRRLYNSVPENERGESAAMVKAFIDDLEFAKSTHNTEKMRAAVDDFDKIEGKLLENMATGEKDGIVIRQDSFQMIAMLRRIWKVGEHFLKRFNNAADALIAKFTDAGFGRHERLFALLTELKNAKIIDGQRPDQLFEQLEEIKQNYIV